MTKNRLGWWLSAIALVLIIVVIVEQPRPVHATPDAPLFGPDDPFNLSPINQIFPFDQSVIITWETTGNVSYCIVTVSPQGHSGSPIVSGQITAKTFTLTSLAKGSYTWDIVCYNSQGESIGRGEGLFHIEIKTAPNMPINLHPANVSLVVNQSVTLAWETDDTTTECHVELYKPDDTIIQSGLINTRSYSTYVDVAGKYYWHVECFNNMGNWSGWTNANFDVGVQPTSVAVPTQIQPTPTSTPIATSAVAWTALIYLNGDNNLDSYTVQVFNRLESVANNPNLKICVLWDRKGTGNTRRYIVQHDDNPLQLAAYMPDVNVWEMGELNMGDPQTLYDFMDWTSTACVADHYLLSIIDHGGGWSPQLPAQFRQYARTGMSWDDTDGNAFLSTQDLGSVLKTFTTKHHKIDVVFFDACLMATIENVYEVKDYVDFLVASENESWAVFPYDLYLADISAATQPRDLVNKFVNTYDQQLGGYPQTIVGLSASSVTPLAVNVSRLAETLATVPSQQLGAIRAAFNSAQKLDCNGDNQLTEKDSCVDLYHFAQLLKQNIPDTNVQTATQAVLDAIGEVGGNFVIAEKHHSGFASESEYWNLANAHGLSIYVPFGKKDWLYDYYIDKQLTFARDTQWDEFLGNYLGKGVNIQQCPELGGAPTPILPGARIGPLSIVEFNYLPLITK